MKWIWWKEILYKNKGLWKEFILINGIEKDIDIITELQIK